MSLHKICKSINMSSQEWRNYCLWRKHDFATFDWPRNFFSVKVLRVDLEAGFKRLLFC